MPTRNEISHALALRLKEAGFPQPENLHSPEELEMLAMLGVPPVYYPTQTELIREVQRIGNNHTIHIREGEEGMGGMWELRTSQSGGSVTGKTIVETLAKAYIAGKGVEMGI